LILIQKENMDPNDLEDSEMDDSLLDTDSDSNIRISFRNRR
jgi:hypothetical protein